MQPRSRRSFLKAAALGSGRTLGLAAPSRKAILFVLPAEPRGAVAEPVRRAAAELLEAMRGRGRAAEMQHDLAGRKTDAERIVLAPAAATVARQIAERARMRLPDAPEALALAPGRIDGQPVLLA